jgi:hypothetical protein
MFQFDLEGVGRNCPPADYEQRQIDPVYRWVFDLIEDGRNFLPPFHRNPPRFIHADQKLRCEAMALSMFDNLGGAMERFSELKSSMGPRIYLLIGSKVAVGSLSETDGVFSKSGHHGHFNVHPSETADFSRKFKITEEAL